MKLKHSLAATACVAAGFVFPPAAAAETTGANTFFEPPSPGLLDKTLPESDPSNRFVISGAVTFGEAPQASIPVACPHEEPDSSVTPSLINPAATLDKAGSFSFKAEKLGATSCLVTALPGVGPFKPSDLAAYHGQIYTGASREARTLTKGVNKGLLTEVAFGIGTSAGIASVGDPITAGSPDSMIAVSPGDFGLPRWSHELWAADANLAYSSGGRTAVQVDGTNVESTKEAAARSPEASGLLGLTVEPPTIGPELHVVVIEPFMRCSGECESYSSSGVQLRRSSTTSAGGREVDTQDSWQSTDGKSHTIDVMYQYGVEAPEAGTPGFSLPWVGGGFTSHAAGGVVPNPPGEFSTIYAQRTLGNSADTEGWLQLSTKPDLISFFPESGFRMEFKRTVPAGGSTVIDQKFGIDTAAPLVVEGKGGGGTPPPPPGGGGTPPPAPPAAAAARFGPGAGYRRGVLTFSVACQGLPGQTCTVGAVLTAKIPAPKRGRGARAGRTRTVTLLRKSLTVAAGATQAVKLRLPKSATALIPRRGALTANLTLTQAGTGVTAPRGYRVSLRR